MLLHLFYFMRVVVGSGFVGAAFRDGFCAFHHQIAAFGAGVAGRLGFDRELAVRIIGAGIKYSKTASSLCDVALLACRTYYAGPFLGFFGFIFLYKFAFRVTR